MSLDEKDVDLNSFSKKLGDSFKKWGFCGVKNHGIDTELVAEIQNLFKEFFNLPEDRKRNFHMTCSISRCSDTMAECLRAIKDSDL